MQSDHIIVNIKKLCQGKMALRQLILLCVAVAISADQCRFLQNYIFFNVSGENNLSGVSPANARRCLNKAMAVVENTISGLRLLDAKDNPDEEAKIAIGFQKLIVDDIGLAPTPSETTLNCTISRSCPTFAVQSAKIYFNTNMKFVCKQYPEPNIDDQQGVDLFQTALYEILHAFGLQTNDDKTSIMYRQRDNFEYQDDGHLNEADRNRVGQLYHLRSAPKN